MPAYGVDAPATLQALGVYVKLLRAYRSVMGRIEPVLAESCLTPTQFGVLEGLLHKGPMTHRQLGRTVLTSAGNMTDVVDKLAARNLVRRVRATDDRRSVWVELTPCGRTAIQLLFPRHATDIAAALAGLNAAELAQLGGLLRKLGLSATASCPEETAPHILANSSISND